MDLVLTHEEKRNKVGGGGWRLKTGRLFGAALGQPLLTAALCFPLFGFLADARLLVVPPPLQFPKEPFSGKLFLRNFERFLDVVIEDFDFHSSRVRTFPGKACAECLPDRPGGGV